MCVVKVRTAKSKGSQFEMDCAYSLKQIYPDLVRYGAEGFQRKFDLCSDKYKLAVECKKHKGISWNELVKLHDKLEDVKPFNYESCILFQSNRQPCLVFWINSMTHNHCINTFEDVFGVPFLKHPSTRTERIKKSVEK